MVCMVVDVEILPTCLLALWVLLPFLVRMEDWTEQRKVGHR